jgi:capsular polysaccharide biosynthesis protein
MELRAYWRVLRRRWLPALIPAVIVLALGAVTYRRPPSLYNAGVRFLISQPPAPDTATSDEEGYHTWLESEYLVNSISDWVRGNRFGVAVSEELASRGIAVTSGEISGNLVADSSRSTLTLSLSHGDPEQVVAMLDAAAAVLREQNGEAIPQLGGEPAVVQQLDEPIVNPTPPGLRSQLDLALRVGLAIAAGLALAFFVDYVDPMLHIREDVEKLGLPVIGEIPPPERR